MDAQKALEALQAGRMFDLVDSLDWDQSMSMRNPDDQAQRLFTGRIGRSYVTCSMEDETDHEELSFHVFDTVEDAKTVFDRKLAVTQQLRAAAVAMAGYCPPLMVDGLLTPIPEATTAEVIAGLEAATARARALAEVPDDLSTMTV